MIIRQSSSIGDNCIYHYELPSYSSQLMFCYITLFIFLKLSKKSNISLWSMLYISTFGYLILFQRIYRKVNTPNQILLGALIGLLDGLIGFLIFYFIIYPNSPYIEKWNIIKKLNIKNHFFNSNEYLNKNKLDFLLAFNLKYGKFKTLDQMKNFYYNIKIEQFNKSLKNKKKFNIEYNNNDNVTNPLNDSFFGFPSKIIIQ